MCDNRHAPMWSTGRTDTDIAGAVRKVVQLSPLGFAAGACVIAGSLLIGGAPAAVTLAVPGTDTGGQNGDGSATSTSTGSAQTNSPSTAPGPFSLAGIGLPSVPGLYMPNIIGPLPPAGLPIPRVGPIPAPSFLSPRVGPPVLPSIIKLRQPPSSTDTAGTTGDRPTAYSTTAGPPPDSTAATENSSLPPQPVQAPSVTSESSSSQPSSAPQAASVPTQPVLPSLVAQLAVQQLLT